jgi:CBS domain-containing protein
MSPRAASRLETLGFAQVFDYVAGKADWGSAGLPLEGSAGPRAGDHTRRDVPICRLDERLSDVQARVRASGWDTCIVVSERGVVLGRLGRRALGAMDDAWVEDAMTSGPSTIRPSVALAAILARMRERDHTDALVTRSDGTLVGLLRREDAEMVVDSAAET